MMACKDLVVVAEALSLGVDVNVPVALRREWERLGVAFEAVLEAVRREMVTAAESVDRGDMVRDDALETVADMDAVHVKQ